MKYLKRTLDKFYGDFDFAGHIKRDPIEFPHRYKDPGDIEAVSFISSCFAYGKVELFKSIIEKILSVMGRSPYSFLLDFNIGRQKRFFDFKYRFNESEDIVCLLHIMRRLLIKYSSLENAFGKYFATTDINTGNALSGLIGEIMSIETSSIYGKDIRPRGLTQFFPSPQKGSACKRMNLFLRWMVRDRDIDFGLWKGIPRNKLVIPLDTHIAGISQCLGLTDRRSSDWKAAVEITEALKKFDSEDPLKYDFALCHHGISGVCKSRSNPGCMECVLRKAS